MNGVEYWRELGLNWLEAPRQQLWRAFHDRVVAAWVISGLPPDARRLLKTDLFEEAVGEPLLEVLADRVELAFGVDLSLPLARAGRRRSPDGEAAAGDVLRLPVAEASLDVVVSTSTLDHFEEPKELERSLHELRRVLRPGGSLLLTLDNLDNPVVRLRNRLVRSRVRAFGLVPYRVGVTVGRRRLREMLSGAGFSMVRMGALIHPLRTVAIPLCERAEHRWGRAARERLLRFLAAWDKVGRLPTRFVTGYYLAVVARRSPVPDRVTRN